MSLQPLRCFFPKIFSAYLHCSIHLSRVNRTVNLFNVYIFTILFLSTQSTAHSISIKGKIVDATTQLPVSAAQIMLRETGETKKSDERGYFQFQIKNNGSYTISISHFAFATIERIITIDFNANDTIEIALQSKIFQSDGIIVQSTRLQTTQETTPFPASILSSNELVRKNSMTISDVLGNSPGLSIVRDGAWETAISIRGMSRSNIVMLIDNSRIETANDIAGALSLFNSYDLEKVETIRSSGAALYGSGAIGGIVHLMSKHASFSDEFQMNSQLNSDYSSVNNYQSQHIAIEGSSEQFASRFSGGFRNADNTMTPAGEISNSQFTDFTLNGSIGLKMFENQTLNLSYQRSQAENTGISGGSPISSTARATYKIAKRELFSMEYQIPNITQNISSLSIRISQQNIVRNVEIKQTPMLTLTPHAIHATTSGQIESNISFFENNFLVIGADIWQRSLESKREKINSANSTVTGERPIPESQFFSTGLYGQHEWIIIPEKTTLIIGARYDWISIGNEETRNPEYIITNGMLNSSPTNQIILWKKGSTQNESWSGNAGIQYSLRENINLSFLASTAFRSPSLEERFQYLTLGDGIHVGNPDLKPERSIGVNAGLFWHTTESNIRIDFFLNTLTNLVTDMPGTFEGSGAFVKQNISKARLYGYEISGNQMFTSWSEVNFSLSYVRGEDTFNHGNLPLISPLHGNIELTIREQKIGSVSISASVSAPQYYTGFGEKQSSGYSLFDIDAASVPITINQFSIIIRGGIQNIFNTDYRNHLSTIRGNVTSEPERNFFLSLTVLV